MKKQIVWTFLSLFLFAHLASAASKTVDADVWDLTPIYASDEIWTDALQKLQREIPELSSCRGQMTSSADKLKACLDLEVKLTEDVRQLSTYAQLKRSADQRDSRNMERADQSEDLASQLSKQSSFIQPEILKLNESRLAEFYKEQPELEMYRHYLQTVFDQAPHILERPEQEIISQLSPVLWNRQDIQDLLLSTDIPWPRIAVSAKKTEKLDVTNYTRLREVKERSIRKKVFDQFFATLRQYESTLGNNLASHVRTAVIESKIYKYPDARTASMESEHIPTKVYDTLISEVHEGLPFLHRYMKLRQQRLKLKTLEIYDLYVPIAAKPPHFTLSEAKEIFVKAVAPLGKEYTDKLSAALADRWMDAYPRPDKQAGAFMSPGAYRVHPYVLMNFQNNFDGLTTLAHEWGHAMHSVLTNENQPTIYRDYSIFVSEIASQLNEILLLDYLIRNSSKPADQQFYIESLLEMIRTSFFRQTHFAEFQYKIHKVVESGQALSGKKLSQIYGELYRQYYGQDLGVTKIDSRFDVEWAYIPHFYQGFYVYKYATSLAAAFYFADQILENKPGAVDRYLQVLKAGSSNYAFDVLKDAGLDLSEPDAYKALLLRGERALSQIRPLTATAKRAK